MRIAIIGSGIAGLGCATPEWRTVAGGARTYVERIVAQLDDVRLSTPVRRVRRDANHVELEFEYAHPVMKGAAVAVQQRFAPLQGQRRTWCAGAWLGHGFHEDGLESAHRVADGIAAPSAVVVAELAAA